MSRLNRLFCISVAVLVGCSDGPTKDTESNNDTVANNATTASTNNTPYRLAASYELGEEPRKPVLGFFDDDEFVDVIVVNQFSADARFFLGDGNGGFAESSDTWGRAVAAVAADFDGDGTDDVAYSTDEARVAVVLDPMGTPIEISLDVADLPDGLAVADFDGDGDIDLAVSIAGNASEPAASVAIFPWGEATFGPETLASVGLQPRGLAVIGIDLVVLLGTKSALVLQNNGAASFAASAPFGLGEGVLDFVVIDIDGSGTPDVVAADLSAGVLNAALDVPGTDAETLVAIADPYGVVALRANDDETTDLAVTSIADESVVGLLSKADGTYGKTVLGVMEGAKRLGDIVATDLDGDEIDDLLVIERGSTGTTGRLHVFLSTPAPTP